MAELDKQVHLSDYSYIPYFVLRVNIYIIIKENPVKLIIMELEHSCLQHTFYKNIPIHEHAISFINKTITKGMMSINITIF